MLGQNEAITAQTILAPPFAKRELAYGSLSYEQPIGPWGTKLKLFGSATDTEPGWDLDQFNVRGNSWQLGAQATHPFIRSRSENLTGRLTLDWRKVRSANTIENTRKDRITSLRAGGRYEFIDMLLGVAANTVDAELSQGIGLFGTSKEGGPDLTRAKGDPRYTKLEAEYQRLQRITPSVNLLGSVRGQIASVALLSSEEFGLGGITGGRGYDPSEVVGDDGIAAKLELQWKEPVKLDSKFVDSYQLYTFYDVGTVWNQDATSSLQKRDSLASAGAGVRVDLPYDVEAGLAVAVPLTRRVATKNDHDPKVYFNLSKKF
jgi:hemolysin activation/secretion protein